MDYMVFEDRVAPKAGEKLLGRLELVIKKATKRKEVKRGIKDVRKAINKEKKGIVVIAADVYPIDLISHIPVLCETSNLRYVFVPSKTWLGAVSGSQNAVSCVMICPARDSPCVKYCKKLESTIMKLPVNN